MTRATLQLEGDRLRLAFEQTVHDRTLTKQDRTAFDRWTDQYRAAVTDREDKQVLRIARELTEWFNRDGWLSELLEANVAPLVLEIVSPQQSDEEQVRLRELPWELLLHPQENTPLCGRADIGFCPVRRIGQVTQPSQASPFRLSMVFMAAVPQGQSPLDLETEEVVILNAAERIGEGIDFRPEESGTFQELLETIDVETDDGHPPDVLHLSCHGGLEPEPHLAFETDEGRLDRVTAAQLADQITTPRPRLTVLSACHSAATAETVPRTLVDSLAVTLVRHAFPSVLGFAGKVNDRDATRFAGTLYHWLARKSSLEQALARARQELLHPTEAGAEPSNDWHLARLYLGPTGGGTLVRGTKARRLWNAKHAHRSMLDASNAATAVAGPATFVGRRAVVQRLLRTFRGTSKDPAEQKCGALLYAVGRQGKSSTAYRVMQRLVEHRPVVLYGTFDALYVLRQFEQRIGGQAVQTIVDKYKPLVADNPAQLKNALQELLSGPCVQYVRQANDHPAQHPVLLVLDDFEQMLHFPQGTGAAPHLDPQFPKRRAAVIAILRAFQAVPETKSCLMITCRSNFELQDEGDNLMDGLLLEPLPPMQPIEQRKQFTLGLFDKGTRPEEVDSELQNRILQLSFGNPGLQDMLTRLALDDADECRVALDQMQARQDSGADVAHDALVEFFQGIALNRQLDVLTDDQRDLLRCCT
ncbi:MAG: CHAT domain-containing protein, partial [Planctomycetaceae bacterium]